MRTKKKVILSWSFATPAARTIRPTSDPLQPVRRSWIGAGPPLGVPSALRRNAFCLSRETCGLQFLASFQCFCILSPRACELEHQSTLLGIVRLCSSAEAFLRMIFIHFSQSWHGKPLHRIVPILGSGVPHSGSSSIGQTSEKISGLHRGAGLLQLSGAASFGTGTPRAELVGCVRPRGHPLLWCNDGRGRPWCRGRSRGLSLDLRAQGIRSSACRILGAVAHRPCRHLLPSFRAHRRLIDFV